MWETNTFGQVHVARDYRKTLYSSKLGTKSFDLNQYFMGPLTGISYSDVDMNKKNTMVTLHSFCHQHKGGELTGIITAE